MLRKSTLHQRSYLSILIAGILYLLVLVVPQVILYGMGIKDPLTFFICFAFDAILWFAIVPYALRLPAGNRSFIAYLRNIRLYPENAWLTYLKQGALVFVAWSAGMAIPVVLAGRFAPDVHSILPPKSWMIFWGFKAGLFEEIAVRGVILVLLLKRHQARNALLWSALLFGLGHTVTLILGDPLADGMLKVTYAILGGFFFGYLFLWTDSLLPGIVCHYLIDALGGLILHPMFQPDVGFTERAVVILAGWVLATFAMIVTIKAVSVPQLAGVQR